MKWFLCLLPMVLAFSTAFACPYKDTVREAVYSYEIDKVEALMARIQHDFASGALSSEGIACAYGPFTALRPETLEFAGHWLDRHPASPFAKAAKAISLRHFGAAVRGTRPASMTYVGALMQARDLQAEADRLTEETRMAFPALASALEINNRPEDEGLDALIHNPIDPNLIRLLGADPQLAEVDLVDLTEHLLIAFPYDPEHWQLYASVRRLGPEEVETVRINQLVYANQTPEALLGYLRWKAEDVEAGGKICPFVRAYRLHRSACSMARDSACNLSAVELAMFDAIVVQTSTSGACFEERNLPLSKLAFSAIPLR